MAQGSKPKHWSNIKSIHPLIKLPYSHEKTQSPTLFLDPCNSNASASRPLNNSTSKKRPAFHRTFNFPSNTFSCVSWFCVYNMAGQELRASSYSWGSWVRRFTQGHILISGRDRTQSRCLGFQSRPLALPICLSSHSLLPAPTLTDSSPYQGAVFL